MVNWKCNFSTPLCRQEFVFNSLKLKKKNKRGKENHYFMIQGLIDYILVQIDNSCSLNTTNFFRLLKKKVKDEYSVASTPLSLPFVTK